VVNGGRIEEGYSLFYLWGYKVGGIFQNQAEIDAWRARYSDATIGQTRTGGYAYKPGDMYFQDVYGNPTNPKERYSQTPDSIINSNDRTYLGKTIPGYYYGFNFAANYKNLTLAFSSRELVMFKNTMVQENHWREWAVLLIN
jgi:hypothetical protein